MVVVKPVMLGELSSVVEADSFTQRLWKFAELSGDGPSGQHSFSIERVQHDAEARLPLLITINPWPYLANSMQSASQ